jgi:AraC-like DNA-binding protein
LQRLFEVEKIYRKLRLSVDDVAKELGTNSDRISKMLNQEYQKPFSDFVNAYRIAEAREILKGQERGGEYAHYTIQAVAQVVGFRSASAFYSAFRQEVGVTPTEYKDAIRRMG